MLPSALCISQGLFVGEKVREMSGEENFEKNKTKKSWKLTDLNFRKSDLLKNNSNKSTNKQHLQAGSNRSSLLFSFFLSLFNS